jgi:predicted membrane GTPase involved in stress response
MYSRFPLECECSFSIDRFNLSFARKAMEVLRPGKEVAFEPSRRGLTMLAETELALERPISVLRDVYGNNVRVSPPRVRYHQGAQLEEPHMGLRIRCEPRHFETLRADLLGRNATLIDAEQNHLYSVLRATAPLAELVGYPAHVREVTDGKSQLVMWLSHYEPVKSPPPGGNAA